MGGKDGGRETEQDYFPFQLPTPERQKAHLSNQHLQNLHTKLVMNDSDRFTNIKERPSTTHQPKRTVHRKRKRLFMLNMEIMYPEEGKRFY